MSTQEQSGKIKAILKITGIPVLVASLCCLAPVVLVAFGLGTVAFAASLANTFYGQYRWVFRIAGLLLLTISLVFYFRQKGICTLDAARRRRNEIINGVFLTLTAAVVGYVVWLYVIVEYLGKLLHIWK